jgi:hypothetical protein
MTTRDQLVLRSFSFPWQVCLWSAAGLPPHGFAPSPGEEVGGKAASSRSSPRRFAQVHDSGGSVHEELRGEAADRPSVAGL